MAWNGAICASPPQPLHNFCCLLHGDDVDDDGSNRSSDSSMLHEGRVEGANPKGKTDAVATTATERDDNNESNKLRNKDLQALTLVDEQMDSE